MTCLVVKSSEIRRSVAGETHPILIAGIAVVGTALTVNSLIVLIVTRKAIRVA